MMTIFEIKASINFIFEVEIADEDMARERAIDLALENLFDLMSHGEEISVETEIIGRR